MARKSVSRRKPVDHTFASDCLTSLDGGKTWVPFNKKTARNKRIAIERDERGVYFVKVSA